MLQNRRFVTLYQSVTSKRSPHFSQTFVCPFATSFAVRSEFDNAVMQALLQHR